MRSGRLVLWWTAVFVSLTAATHAADPPTPLQEPRITAVSAIVMDAGTGEILWSRSPDLELPPASTTKVMTAILALESGELGASVTTSSNAAQVVPSKINLQPGQRLALEDLVYAILLNSANDASIAIAEHLAGSVPAFGQRMTSRARQLGALHTRFTNPHGLTEPEHYSTTADLARIFRHALRVPRFRQIIGTKQIVVGVEDSRRRIALRSHNRLLENYRIRVIGKTGFTIAAKKCFVGAGTHDGREVIIALLGSRDLWGDAKRLLEYGYGDAMPPEPNGHVLRAKRTSSAERVASRRVEASRAAPAGKRGVYSIHVGTFDHKDRADRLRRALGSRGYDAAVERVASGRGKRKRTQYRVRVGSYADRSAAESAVRKMASQVDLQTRIVKR